MRLADILWGDDSAEKDPSLFHYFVASDALRRVRGKTKSIVVGRKGSGKSALRQKLSQEFKEATDTFVVNLSPRYNSIRNVLNEKDIVTAYGKEIFFEHTWLRQILLDSLCAVGNNAKGKFTKDSMEFARKVALELNQTSKDFVENVTEILSKVRARAGSLGEFGIKIEEELRSIADVDALEYHVLDLAAGGAQFVILVDDLDLGWDNSPTANNMLLGLLAACKHLSSKSHNVFCCVFLREDVYSLLITQTQHSDKFRNVERIRWDHESLLNILEQRINYNRMLNELGSAQDPFATVFPQAVGTSNTKNWLIERTLGRPRELIQLARYYAESVDGEEPDAEALKRSELSYSSWKLDDLCTEYSNQYPALIDIFSFWKTNFYRRKYHLRRTELDEMLLQVMMGVNINQPWWNSIVDKTDVIGLLNVLYEIGFIGDFLLGGEGGSKTIYSFQEVHQPRFEEVQIHPCFRKSVNTVERIRTKKGDGTEIPE